VKKVSELEDVEGDEDIKLEDGWDRIVIE